MSFNIETKCVQSGYTPKNGEPRVVPIVQSTTYKYESSEQMGRLFDLQESGYFYTRLQNPTNDCVAAKIADLEGGVGAIDVYKRQDMHGAQLKIHIVCHVFN